MTLHEHGLKHGSDKATAHGYLDFYEARIGNPKSILEFGVLGGASLAMWRDAYPATTVIGLDINKVTPPDNTYFFQLDCTRESWITKIKPSFDLIIDDAGHMTLLQVAAFELWWPMVAKGGHFIIEDCHTMHYTQYNPTKFDFKDWVEGLGIKHEYFKRLEDESDSMTVIFYK